MSVIPKRHPLLLVVLDGWGVNPRRDYNAIAIANPPYWNSLLARHANTTLLCGGKAVGLPDDQFGNSEVGHLNLGAGRVVGQDISRIDVDIKSGEFFENPAFLAAIEHTNAYAGGRGRIHLMGLVSDGGVHSSDRHYKALLQLFHKQKFDGSRVCFHVITDGRDTSPKGGVEYVRALEAEMSRTGVGFVASVSGRYYAMDRDTNWERTQLYYDCITLGQGEIAASAVDAIEASYDNGVTDEFIKPTLIARHGGAGLGRVQDGDCVIFFNFRADRARQICRTLTEGPEFDKKCFARKARPAVKLVAMTPYLDGLNAQVAFGPQPVSKSLGEVLAARGIQQFRCAETEKYAHVTYFFNGGNEKPNPGEERKLIPSPKVATYDLKPEMSLPEVSRAVADALASKRFGFVLTNFANGDMVGHTGNLQAAVKAVGFLDAALKLVVEAANANGFDVLVTADHGNCDEMADDKGEVLTNHSYNPVPLVYVPAAPKGSVPDTRKLGDGGALCDVAPTVLALMGEAQPPEMTGKSLLV